MVVAGNYPRPDTDSHMVAQAATPQAKMAATLAILRT